MTDEKNINYVVLLIDSKFKAHDGRILQSYAGAKEFCRNVIAEGYADKIVIGTVNSCIKVEYEDIYMIETMGFKSDVKDVDQLDMFKKPNTPNQSLKRIYGK